MTLLYQVTLSALVVLALSGCGRGRYEAVLDGGRDAGEQRDAMVSPDAFLFPDAFALTCAERMLDCDGLTSNGCEVDAHLASSCGVSCASLVDCASLPGALPTSTCIERTCVLACADGLGDCDAVPANGCETSLTTPTSCGTCEARLDCTTLPNIASGTCRASDARCTFVCAAGWDSCNTSVADGCETVLNPALPCR